MSTIFFIIEFTDFFCAKGRLLTGYPMFLVGVYISLYSQAWNTYYSKAGLNIVMDLLFIWNHYLWLKYAQEDMSNFKLHGNYQVGFKRWVASEGNQCLIFYPAEVGAKIVPVTPYKDVAKYIKGCKIIGMAPGQ